MTYANRYKTNGSDMWMWLNHFGQIFCKNFQIVGWFVNKNYTNEVTLLPIHPTGWVGLFIHYIYKHTYIG